MAQTGGLAEVGGEPAAGLEGSWGGRALAIPAYRTITEHGGFQPVARDLPVRLGPTHLTAEILGGGACRAGIRRRGPPGRVVRSIVIVWEFQGEYFDNPERFIFFSRAVPAMCGQLGWTPDVILANDWQTGLIMAMLDLGALPAPPGSLPCTNQAYLGLVPRTGGATSGCPTGITPWRASSITVR